MKRFVFHCFVQQPSFIEGFDRFEVLNTEYRRLQCLICPRVQGGNDPWSVHLGMPATLGQLR